LGKKYNLHYTQIDHIIKGKQWGWAVSDGGKDLTQKRAGMLTREKAIPKLIKGEFKNQKLTVEKVKEIRTKYKTGKYRQDFLGKEYGVSAVMISRIILRKAWDWVP
jgi:hypothetical protein